MSPRGGVGRTAAPLRLALFTDTYAPQVNGVARTLERLVHAVEARGGAVRVETVEDPSATDDSRVRRWPSSPFWAYPQLRMSAPPRPQLLQELRAWGPTLIHVATPFGVGLAGRAASRALGVPLVTSYHTSFSEYLRHYKLSALDAVAWPFLRWFHNSGVRTFAPSQMVKARLGARGFRDVRVWSRGVDPMRFHPRFRTREMRAAMGADDDTIVIAYVGRLAPEKGIHVALEGLRDVVATHGSRVRIAIAGDGPDEMRCRENAPVGTWFAGALHGEELSSFYASSDVLVFPSTTETFGNVVLEAMASGVPVVAPDVGATLELANAHTAALFRAGNPSSLAEVVSALIHNPTRRHRLRAAALAHASTRPWEAVWDALINEYVDLCDGYHTKTA